MGPKTIQKGAEAVIYLDNNKVIKDRVKKSYRISVLDEKLRKRRTKSEAKIFYKLFGVVPVPKVFSSDKFSIVMEFIKGVKLSEGLEVLNYKVVCKKIGENLTKIHDSDIIHGDLTTSNMIFKRGQVFFIDFGLGFHSKKIEDKAVDLHLLKQALDAKHFKVADDCFRIILNNYNPVDKKLILERITAINRRGRYKGKKK